MDGSAYVTPNAHDSGDYQALAAGVKSPHGFGPPTVMSVAQQVKTILGTSGSASSPSMKLKMSLKGTHVGKHFYSSSYL